MPQVPTVEPGARMQVEPEQQSALMVHEEPLITQFGPSSGMSAQRRTPSSSGTHGTSSQQSSLDAHCSPASMQLSPSPLQRGTPRASSWQTPPFAPKPPQQFARAEEMLQA
jgi:hypothetical protein